MKKEARCPSYSSVFFRGQEKYSQHIRVSQSVGNSSHCPPFPPNPAISNPSSPNLLPRYAESGVERRLWVGERAPKPWVGEPGKLSLEDKERFKDDKLRLVCSKFDCLVILRNKELRFLLPE